VDPSAPPTAGLVGPLGSSTFSLPAVERALAEMEGGGSAGGGKRAGGGAPSPTGQTQHEVLQNFFKSLLNTKDRGASPNSASAVSPGAAAGKPGTSTGPRTSGGGGAAGGGGGQADAGSGTEDG
jgi:dynein light intermediate chain 1